MQEDKSPTLAALGELWIPGAGSFYLNRAGQGMTWLVLTIIAYGIEAMAYTSALATQAQQATACAPYSPSLPYPSYGPNDPYGPYDPLAPGAPLSNNVHALFHLHMSLACSSDGSDLTNTLMVILCIDVAWVIIRGAIVYHQARVLYAQ